MNKFFFCLLILFYGQISYGQFSLKILVNDVATKKQDDIYITGSFNNWNTRDENFKLKPFGTTRRGLVIKDLPQGEYSFKFTRGSTDKLESSAKGEDIPAHKINLQGDVTVDFSVAGWKDDYPEKPIPNTATPQVQVVDTAFFIPGLNRHRRIWIYLPKGYANLKMSYPVLYMNDGQNLFNEQLASNGEWGLDECLDTMLRKLNKELIVVAIANGGESRSAEFNPYTPGTSGNIEGEAYAAFIANTLKPYIDKKCRTLKDVANTFIGGGEKGGLISLYALAKYPSVFGGAGIFSTSFSSAPTIFNEVENASWNKIRPKLFLYAGGLDSKTLQPEMDKLIKIIQAKGNYEFNRIYNPASKNNEQGWREHLPLFFTFLLK